MTTVTVLGAGYVGLTTAVCLAHLGHRVHTVDIDSARVRRLSSGYVDLLEPDLPEMVHDHQCAGRLSFTDTAEPCLVESEAVFLCLPTPALADGSADLTAVDGSIPELRRQLAPGSQLVVKSTVPPGTHCQLTAALNRSDIAVTSNPEFLREGTAVHDWLYPDRIVIGAEEPEQAYRVAAFYKDLDAPHVLTDPTSAELIKYAANVFLALKITYANTLAELSEDLGANVTDVVTGLGHDHRIGPHYLRPGPGWGGPCLPKDTRALLSLRGPSTIDLGLLDALVDVNAHHQRRVVALVEQLLARPLAGARIGVLGLTFKPGTNDLRESPTSPITTTLEAHRARVTAYDPAITKSVPGLTDHLTLTSTADAAIAGADLVVLLTEWPEFTTLPWHDLARTMRGTVVLDARGQLDPDVLARSGLDLHALGSARAGRSTMKTV